MICCAHPFGPEIDPEYLCVAPCDLTSHGLKIDLQRPVASCKTIPVELPLRRFVSGNLRVSDVCTPSSTVIGIEQLSDEKT
jgi:hypothetical protein